MGHGTAAEVMALVLAGKPLALRGARDVDPLTGREKIGLERLAHFVAGGVRLEADLAHVTMGADPGLLEVSGGGLGEFLLLDPSETKLHRAVAVLLHRPKRDHDAGPGLEHSDRQELTLLGEHLGHPDLLGQQPFRRHR